MPRSNVKLEMHQGGTEYESLQRRERARRAVQGQLHAVPPSMEKLPQRWETRAIIGFNKVLPGLCYVTYAVAILGLLVALGWV